MNLNKDHTDMRLASFFRLMHAGLKIQHIEESEIEKIIKRLADALQDYTIADDDVVVAIQKVINGELENLSNQKSMDFILTNETEKLCFPDEMTGKELLDILKQAGLPEYYTTKRLIAKLRNLRSNLRREGILFESIIGAHNQRKYHIKKI